jgi:predicted esterase
MMLHQGLQVRAAGAALSSARAACIMLHGRGANAASILELAEVLDVPDVAYLAPEAAGGTWYPNRFMAPLDSNEPWLSSALAVVGDAVARAEQAGISSERIVLLGFSQGACLALEYAARNAGRWGGVVGLSGGLIGPDGAARNDSGSLDGAPVFLGCSDVDPHIPTARVEDAAAVLSRLGGDVTLRLYRGMGHTVNADEVAFVRELLQRVAALASSSEG